MELDWWADGCFEIGTQIARPESHQNGGGQNDIMRSAHRPLFHSLGMRSPFDRDSAAAAAHADIRSESKKLLGQ